MHGCREIANFAAGMKGKSRTLGVIVRNGRRRTATAWLLLAVFVPTMLLTGMHRHEAAESAASECVDCAHHAQHSGHLTAASGAIHECLLCQFLRLVYTSAAPIMVALLFFFTCAVSHSRVRFVCREVDRRQSPRAPPFML